ncbi:MAG: hypothetical protein PHX75_00375 [Candidatus Methanomethylophilaceae archaeon]|nr:hypothetical protein [Candidatus Methanomethylophilaceae archaeon]
MDYIPELLDLFGDMGKVAVCFSGGLDSTALAAHAQKALGEDCVAIMIDMPTLSDVQREMAMNSARASGVKLITIPIAWSELNDISDNGERRCYFCKKAMFSAVRRAAVLKGFQELVSGENADDDLSDRPGMSAGKEAGVRYPLRELGIGRSAIERFVSSMDLERKPFKETCLLTRFPTGTTVSEEDLRFAEACEGAVRAVAGIGLVRVRISGRTCTVVSSYDERPLLFDNSNAVISTLKGMGFKKISLDPDGYS